MKEKRLSRFTMRWNNTFIEKIVTVTRLLLAQHVWITLPVLSLCLAGIFTLTWWLLRPVPLQAQPTGDLCAPQLPTIEWLGEGAGTYVLGSDFDTFIVKRLPFRFVMAPGTPDGAGNTTYEAADGERVWRCSGNCQLPAVYHAGYDLGQLAPGTRVNLVVIDDDIDNRLNWWAVDDPQEPYLVITDQQMVEHITFDIPVAGQWYYYAQDSIGIAATCFEPSVPTPTPTVTATPTVPATATPTVTPSASATPTATQTPSATPTMTPTPSATPTTVVVEPPETVTTATPTVTATVTPPVLPTVGVTPTRTPRIPPTALTLLYFTTTTVDQQIALRWETAFELQVNAFQLWRSTTGDWHDAKLLTADAIPSRGTAGSGALYSYQDDDVQLGVDYTYWLVALNGDGSTEELAHVTAALHHAIYLPLVQQ